MNNWLYVHQQCHDTCLSFFDVQQVGGKVRKKESNVNKGDCYERKKKAVIWKKKILEISVNYHIIYKWRISYLKI